tara:strand:+ start:401 stop:808 length:408 start_codon:yes stop_codon:yes gene_type:complete
MNYKLKRAQRCDEDLLKKIYKQDSEHIGSFNLYQTWDKYLTTNTNYKFLTCEDKAFVRYGYSKKYTSWVIYEIGVLEEHKKMGLARYIVENLPKPMTLKCNCDNTAGNAFYEKIGMTLSGKTHTRKGVAQNIWTW